MEYLELILKGLVDHPDDVAIEQAKDDMGVLLTVKLNQADMGRIIGSQGATAQAVRRLVSIWGLSRGMRISVKITDPAGVRFEKTA